MKVQHIQDAADINQERSRFFKLRLVISGKEILCIFYNHASEKNQREEVRDCHETIADIGCVPEKLHTDERTQRADYHVQNTIDLHLVRAEEKGKGGLAIGIPAQYRGQAEEYQRHDNDDLTCRQ